MQRDYCHRAAVPSCVAKLLRLCRIRLICRCYRPLASEPNSTAREGHTHSHPAAALCGQRDAECQCGASVGWPRRKSPPFLRSKHPSTMAASLEVFARAVLLASRVLATDWPRPRQPLHCAPSLHCWIARPLRARVFCGRFLRTCAPRLPLSLQGFAASSA